MADTVEDRLQRLEQLYIRQGDQIARLTDQIAAMSTARGVVAGRRQA